MGTVYTTPPNVYSHSFYQEILNGNHTLIAGKTGSGKSVLLNAIIYEILCTRLPYDCMTSKSAGLVLIDPKRVELSQFKKLPHTLYHVTDEDKAISALTYANEIMDSRYSELEANGKKKFDRSKIFVIIDEYADFAGNKEFSRLVDRIARLGRAASISLIISTQRPAITDKSLSASTRANLDYRIALRTAEAKDSRMIIGSKGAEELPMFGSCLISFPTVDGIKEQKISMISDTEMDRIVKWWVDQIPQEPEEEPLFRYKVGAMIDKVFGFAFKVLKVAAIGLLILVIII